MPNFFYAFCALMPCLCSLIMACSILWQCERPEASLTERGEKGDMDMAVQACSMGGGLS